MTTMDREPSTNENSDAEEEIVLKDSELGRHLSGATGDTDSDLTREFQVLEESSSDTEVEEIQDQYILPKNTIPAQCFHYITLLLQSSVMLDEHATELYSTIDEYEQLNSTKENSRVRIVSGLILSGILGLFFYFYPSHFRELFYSYLVLITSILFFEIYKYMKDIYYTKIICNFLKISTDILFNINKISKYLYQMNLQFESLSTYRQGKVRSLIRKFVMNCKNNVKLMKLTIIQMLNLIPLREDNEIFICSYLNQIPDDINVNCLGEILDITDCQRNLYVLLRSDLYLYLGKCLNPNLWRISFTWSKINKLMSLLKEFNKKSTFILNSLQETYQSCLVPSFKTRKNIKYGNSRLEIIYSFSNTSAKLLSDCLFEKMSLLDHLESVKDIDKEGELFISKKVINIKNYIKQISDILTCIEKEVQIFKKVKTENVDLSNDCQDEDEEKKRRPQNLGLLEAQDEVFFSVSEKTSTSTISFHSVFESDLASIKLPENIYNELKDVLKVKRLEHAKREENVLKNNPDYLKFEKINVPDSSKSDTDDLNETKFKYQTSNKSINIVQSTSKESNLYTENPKNENFPKNVLTEALGKSLEWKACSSETVYNIDLSSSDETED